MNSCPLPERRGKRGWPVVPEVGEDVVQKGSEEGHHLLLLLAAVHHVQHGRRQLRQQHQGVHAVLGVARRHLLHLHLVGCRRRLRCCLVLLPVRFVALRQFRLSPRLDGVVPSEPGRLLQGWSRDHGDRLQELLGDVLASEVIVDNWFDWFLIFFLYSAIIHSWADSLHSCHMWF